ncbi:hypothetical protein DSO57_1015647 [Entomophthora muscae]|uniref:Uncharacterized protein n=1 Tax=Entomophthora muscae TaxID=34485 RepID=A0ACC2TGJ6_9FUNG|nr:hypothetical protein DSO57_1015647 [Entomophthora muscae]
MVLTTGATSPSVTLFPRAFSGPLLFVSEVPKQPKVSSPLLEKDITNIPSTPMVMVLSPGPAWAPIPALSLNYEKACNATCSLLHTGTVTMHTIPGLQPGYVSKDLYSFLLDFGLPRSNGLHGNYWCTGQPIYSACFGSSQVCFRISESTPDFYGYCFCECCHSPCFNFAFDGLF